MMVKGWFTAICHKIFNSLYTCNQSRRFVSVSLVLGERRSKYVEGSFRLLNSSISSPK